MKKIISVILVIMCMVLIFLFSNQNGNDSTKTSSGFIKSVVKVFVGEEKNDEKANLIIEKYTYLIRKLAHFSIYFILALAVYNMLFQYGTKNIIFYTILICGIYSLTDEFHQIFIPGRSGNIIDVLIDTSGATMGTIMINYILSLFNAK